jgi:hypothetical protein
VAGIGKKKGTKGSGKKQVGVKLKAVIDDLLPCSILETIGRQQTKHVSSFT